MTERQAKKLVKKRYKNRCDACIITTTRRLDVHHLRDKTTYPKFANKPWNMVPLCRKHHMQFHSWNGGTRVPCTERDYERWKKIKQEQFQYIFGFILILLIILYEIKENA